MKTQFAILAIATFATSVVSSVVSADPVEMMLSNKLDGNLDSYCLDISGSKQNAKVSKGLQTHTCYAYQGEMGIDQVFDTRRLAENQLYMPEFNVCATVSAVEPGASIGLSACDDSDSQAIKLTGDGRLTLVSAPDLFLTAGTAHQIKNLTLEACSDELRDYQIWETRG